MGIGEILLLVPLVSLALCSIVFPAGPRFLQLATLACALLALWLLSRWHPAAGLVWLGVFGGLKGMIWLGWQKLEQAKATVSGQAARYLVVARPDHKAPPFVMYLPPLRVPLYWVARRAKVPVAQAGNRPASEFLLPLLDMLFKSSSGFVLDTRHLAGRVPGAKGAPAFVIKCL